MKSRADSFREALGLNKPDCAQRTTQDPTLEREQPQAEVNDLEPTVRTYRISPRRRRLDPEDLAREFWERVFLVAFEWEENSSNDAAELADCALKHWQNRFQPSAVSAPVADMTGLLGSETPTPGTQSQEPGTESSTTTNQARST